MSDVPAVEVGRTDPPPHDSEREAPPTPVGATRVFGDRLALAERFTAILTDSGVSHGLIGPREVPRLWERHVLNCAVIHPAIPVGQLVIDVGSGAGLPGLALAIARPDLELHLVEPKLRRTNWLSMTVADLELTNVTVHRGRAEQFWGTLSAPVVTARAVARLGELATWCLPLLLPGGFMLAIRGAGVAEELKADRAAGWAPLMRSLKALAVASWIPRPQYCASSSGIARANALSSGRTGQRSSAAPEQRVSRWERLR